MIIQPINLNNYFNIQNRISKDRVRKSIAPQNGVYAFNSITADSVSFSGVPGGKVLTEIFKYGIPDMYTGQIMMDPKDFEKLLRNKTFNLPIKKLLKEIKPYEDSLFGVQKLFIQEVRQVSNKYPKCKLDDVIKILYKKNYEELINVQIPILEKLDNEAKKAMTREEYEQFSKLLNSSYASILRTPVIKPFSPKEFNYKLQRISRQIMLSNKPDEIQTIKQLKKLAFSLPPKKARSRRDMRRRDKLQNSIIDEMLMVLSDSPLSKNKEISTLLINAKSEIKRIPTYIPFKRKPFLYDLQEITENMTDKQKGHKLFQIAQTLPTSRQFLPAFIVKANEYSSEKIGYELFEGATCSIEHLIPKSKKHGTNSLYNYGITSRYINSERSNLSFAEQLRKYPETYKNCQKYIDRIIELYNQGLFKNKDYIISFATKIRKISPPERPLILDISKMKGNK